MGECVKLTVETKSMLMNILVPSIAISGDGIIWLEKVTEFTVFAEQVVFSFSFVIYVQLEEK